MFITGASSGIGAAFAKAYAARGASCALLARRGDALEALRAGLTMPGSHRLHAVDVTDADALVRAVEGDIAAHGLPDVVVASAGISAGTDTGDPADLAVFRRIVETNLLAMVASFAPFVAAARRTAGAVPAHRMTLVAIGSVAGVRGLPGSGAYSASKAAVRVYAESLRVETRGTGVTVVTIAPGFIDTPMTRGNPYRMPFLMPVDRFAERAVDAIGRGRPYVVIPWQMGWVARLLRIVPAPIYDALAVRAGRKPRTTT